LSSWACAAAMARNMTLDSNRDFITRFLQGFRGWVSRR
jgi:hypothetical protein